MVLQQRALLHILQLLDLFLFKQKTAAVSFSGIHEILAYLTSSCIRLFFIASSTRCRRYIFISSSQVNGPGMSSFFNVPKRSDFVDSSFRHDCSLSECILSWWALIFSFLCILMSLIYLKAFWVSLSLLAQRFPTNLCFCWWSFFWKLALSIVFLYMYPVVDETHTSPLLSGCVLLLYLVFFVLLHLLHWRFWVESQYFHVP